MPVVPLALKTDAWGTGKKLKELGPIKSGLPVRYKFAAPMDIHGNGREEQAFICDFIGSQLASWRKEDGINA